MFLVALSLVASSVHADDAALKKQLIGPWKGPDGQTFLLKKNGIMTDSERDAPGTWNVRDGVLNIRFHREDSFKIVSLAETKLVIQDMYHGRHTGTWTRSAASKTAASASPRRHRMNQPRSNPFQTE